MTLGSFLPHTLSTVPLSGSGGCRNLRLNNPVVLPELVSSAGVPVWDVVGTRSSPHGWAGVPRKESTTVICLVSTDTSQGQDTVSDETLESRRH